MNIRSIYFVYVSLVHCKSIVLLNYCYSILGIVEYHCLADTSSYPLGKRGSCMNLEWGALLRGVLC